MNLHPTVYETAALSSLSYSAVKKFMGPGKTRTCANPFRRQRLFRLSYGPESFLSGRGVRLIQASSLHSPEQSRPAEMSHAPKNFMAEEGLEPSTKSL